MKLPLDFKYHEWVKVYYNIHKRCFSIQAKTDDGWRVVAHLPHVCIANPKFTVSERGWKRALRQQRRNVHAKIEGYIEPTMTFYKAGITDPVDVRYDLSMGRFITPSNPREEVKRSLAAVLYMEDRGPRLQVKPLTTDNPIWCPVLSCYQKSSH